MTWSARSWPKRLPRLQQVVVLGDVAVDGALALASVEPIPSRPVLDPTRGRWPASSTRRARRQRPRGCSTVTRRCCAGSPQCPPTPASRMLATFPAGHVASLIGLLRPLTAGGTTVVMDRWSARAAAELIEQHRITTSAGTPFFLSTLLDQAERDGRDISSLDRFLCGAAAVPPPWSSGVRRPASSPGAPTDRPSIPPSAQVVRPTRPTNGASPTAG